MKPGKNLTIALCHDWLDTFTGAEKVLKEISEMNSATDTTIFTLWSNKFCSEKFQCKIKNSFLQIFPKKYRRYIGIPLMPIVWWSYRRKISKFDLVISSSWAFAHFAGKNHKRSMCYVHTPGRYWWYSEIDQRTLRKLPKFIINFLRLIDRRGTSNDITYFANSNNTKKRISDCWGKKSEVIYPPVDLEFYKRTKKSRIVDFEEYILGVGRFVEYKNHDFIISLGAVLNVPVVLAGDGPLLERLREAATKSTAIVKIIEAPSNEDLKNLYSHAQCLVYPTVEDFGIVPVEAMACGTPILGLNDGGLKETVKDGVTGVLVEDLNLIKFAKAYKFLPKKNDPLIRKHVKKFDKKNFADAIEKNIRKKMVI